MIGGELTCNKSKTYLWKIVSSYLLGALSTTNLIQEKETGITLFQTFGKYRAKRSLCTLPVLRC